MEKDLFSILSSAGIVKQRASEAKAPNMAEAKISDSIGHDSGRDDLDKSASSSVPSPPPETRSIARKRFFGGAQGKALTSQIAIAGSIGFMLFGYDQGVLSGLNAAEEFLHQFDNPSSTLLGTINAIYE